MKPKNYRSYPVTNISVGKILSTKNRYSNAALRISIDEKYRNLISMLSAVSTVDMSQIVNNMLSILLQNEGLTQELKDFCINGCKEHVKYFK